MCVSVGDHSPRALCRLFPVLFHMRCLGGIVLRLTAPLFIEHSNKSVFVWGGGGGLRTKEERRSQVKKRALVVGCGADEHKIMKG